MDTFTSGRDYNALAAFPTALPLDAVYARVIVAAPQYDDACAALFAINLSRYVETLRGPASPDGPAEAVAAYVSDRGITDPTVFVVYRMPALADLKFPLAERLMVARVAGAELEVVGEVRTVGDTVVVSELLGTARTDDEADLVDTDREGPAADVPQVEGPAMFPDGAIGYLAKMRERNLLSGLAEVRDDLEQAIARIERSRRSADRRASWGRDSSRLLELSRTLAALAGDAAVVEVVLQSAI